jgi:hypothetical protein
MRELGERLRGTKNEEEMDGCKDGWMSEWMDYEP